MRKIKKYIFIKRSGFAAIFSTILILIASSAIILSASYIVYNNLKFTRNSAYSLQAYYAAESGVEDSLLRLSKGMNYVLSNNLTVDSVSATINISIPIGGARTITVEGDKNNRIRKVRAVYSVNSVGASFHYGAQAGEGGVEMGNNSGIKGNVFSNGSIIGSGTIYNSAVVAHNGNKIQDVTVNQDALVYACDDARIKGKLTYVSGGTNTCDVDGVVTIQANEIQPVDLPISDFQINDWKQQAAAGGIINNNVTYSGTSNSLGPIQIGTPSSPKNLLVTNNARLKITGTVYVTGTITFSNNAIIELDNNVYGPLSGVVLADGRIISGNNAILRGSGNSASYILILSTNNSINPSAPAISVSNNAQGAIFYANSGMIYLNNNMKAKEVTGYKIKLNNNSLIEYESGLENIVFSSGPGGSGELTEWKEIE
ncbi:MAG: hypothetical protein V1686_01475 [Patescibacteria group bacterium]